MGCMKKREGSQLAGRQAVTERGIKDKAGNENVCEPLSLSIDP